MSDEIDLANDNAETLLSAGVRDVMSRAATMRVGEAGDCELCGEHYVRLVNCTCARCRDKYKLP
jgi:hypothetical protein